MAWQWMQQQNPDATAEAEQWTKENCADMKAVDRILYRSDEICHDHIAFVEIEEAESLLVARHFRNPESFFAGRYTQQNLQRPHLYR